MRASSTAAGSVTVVNLGAIAVYMLQSVLLYGGVLLHLKHKLMIVFSWFMSTLLLLVLHNLLCSGPGYVAG